MFSGNEFYLCATSDLKFLILNFICFENWNKDDLLCKLDMDKEKIFHW